MTIQVGETESTAFIDSDPGLPLVSVTDDWNSPDWQPVPYLQALWAALRASPAKGEAGLLYHYGNIKRNDKTAFEVYAAQDLNDKFVMIESVYEEGAFAEWFGIIDDESLSHHSGTTYSQGDQSIRAYGLEHLLDRYPINTVKALQGGSPISISRIPEFNRRSSRGGSLFGNRSAEVDADGFYTFSDESNVWSNKDIINSLLKWNLPASSPPFVLSGQVEVLDNIKQVHRFPLGTSLRVALNKLIDRRRGLGWALRVEEADVSIHVYSVLDHEVSFGATTIPANQEQFDVPIDGDRGLQEVITNVFRSAQFQKVNVYGNYLRSIFTVSFTDSNLQTRFSSSLLTEYKEGAKNATNYASESDRNKAKWNDEYRGEDRFDIMGQFRIPSNWDRKSANGEGGSKNPAIPTLGDDGALDEATAATMWLYNKPLLHHLPGMEVGKDYSQDPATDEDATDKEPEFRRPFAVIKDGTRYIYVDKVPEREEINIPNANVRMIDREMALAVDFRPRHVLFNNHWTSAEIGYMGGENFDSTKVFDYEDLVATVAMESDQRVKITAEGNGLENGKELNIFVSDANLVYLAPNTVVGIDDNGALKNSGTSGRLLVDDRARLEAIAALAWAWYSEPRASVTFDAKWLGSNANVGALIKAIYSADETRDVGTVVTEVFLDFKTRKTKIKTQFAHINFGGDFGPELPTAKSVGREISAIKEKQDELNTLAGGQSTRPGVPSSAASGPKIMYAVKVATTANHALTGLANVDGITMASDEDVLVWKQSTASENGLYKTASGAWTKVKDFDASMLYKTISVVLGDSLGGTFFDVTATNTVKGKGAYYK